MGIRSLVWKYRNIVAFIRIVVNTNWAFPSFVEDTWLKSRAHICLISMSRKTYCKISQSPEGCKIDVKSFLTAWHWVCVSAAMLSNNKSCKFETLCYVTITRPMCYWNRSQKAIIKLGHSLYAMIILSLIPAWVSNNPDSKVHWANMGPTWVLSAPDGPHVGHVNLLSGYMPKNVGWNYLSIPKLQRLHRWSLGMDKLFHPTLNNGWN